MTADKQATSEWVEEGMHLADVLGCAEMDFDEAAGALSDEEFVKAENALRAYLECKEREHLATKALVEQLAAALNSFLYEFGDKSNSSTVINARTAMTAYKEKQ
jgi:hypothetical protein